MLGGRVAVDVGERGVRVCEVEGETEAAGRLMVSGILA